MSELKYTLDIHPDKYGARSETKHIRNVTCPRCNGHGSFKEETGHDQFVYIACDLCDGTKKVKATVRVEWEADYES